MLWVGAVGAVGVVGIGYKSVGGWVNLGPGEGKVQVLDVGSCIGVGGFKVFYPFPIA